MLDKIKYVNHLNEVFEFGVNDVYIDENDLRDFVWLYDKYTKRVSNFRKDINTKKLPIKAVGSNRFNRLNELLNITEKDVVDEIYGRLYVGAWYIEGYVFKGAFKGYTDNNAVDFSLEFVTVSSSWIRPSDYNYRTDTYGSESGLGYPYDYPYAYRSKLNIKQIVNEFYTPANFKMIIYGPVNNPSVTIGGHIYNVDCDILSNEYLTIDSVAKTIVLTKQDGTKQNKFNSRNVQSYVFQPIPNGVNTMSTTSEFDFDITLLEERSSPVWT